MNTARLLALAAMLGGGVSASAGTVPADTIVYDLDQDFRRCMYPLCGGYWASEVNLDSSVCADGTVADACYVAELDLSPLGVPPRVEPLIRNAIANGTLLIGGHIEARPFTGFPDQGVLVVNKVWRDPQN